MTGDRSRPGGGRVVVNHGLRPDRVPPPPGPAVTDFHRRLPGYRPTPLRPLADLARHLGLGAVHLKDESDRFGLPAFKILGASWAVEQTLRARPDVGTVVAASAGNHGRAVAREAARRDLACRVHLPATTSATRADLIAREGAEVVRVDGDYDHAVAAAHRAADLPGTALISDTAVDRSAPSATWVIDGYATLFREAATQAPAPFDLVVVGVGVGALAAAAVRWAVHDHPTAAVVGAEPVTAACVSASLLAGEAVTVPIAPPATSMAGLDCATPSAVAWPTVRDGLAGTVVVTDAEAHRAMRDLAALGLTIGDCGAATVAALCTLATSDGCAPLRAAIGLGAATTVLCVGSEGASDPVAYRRTVPAAGTR